MQYYVGLDVSMELTSICILDANGEIFFEDSISTDPKYINMCLKAQNVPIAKIALESGSLSHWLVQELKKLKWPIFCMDARSVSPHLGLKNNKTDRNDARGIAEVLRNNAKSIKYVYHKSNESIELGISLSSRRCIVQQRVSIINNIRGQLKGFGVRLGNVKGDKFIQKARDSLKSLPNLTVVSISTLLSMLENIHRSLNLLEKSLKSNVENDEVIKNLVTIPGIGLITAITFKTVIEDPSRFKNARSIGAYLGMTPTQKSSGKKICYGGVSKEGNVELRSLLTECAISLLTCYKRDCELKTWGLKIVEKHGFMKAKVAVGRKLAILMYHVWINNQAFDPNFFSNKKLLGLDPA